MITQKYKLHTEILTEYRTFNIVKSRDTDSVRQLSNAQYRKAPYHCNKYNKQKYFNETKLQLELYCEVSIVRRP